MYHGSYTYMSYVVIVHICSHAPQRLHVGSSSSPPVVIVSLHISSPVQILLRLHLSLCSTWSPFLNGCPFHRKFHYLLWRSWIASFFYKVGYCSSCINADHGSWFYQKWFYIILVLFFYITSKTRKAIDNFFGFCVSNDQRVLSILKFVLILYLLHYSITDKPDVRSGTCSSLLAIVFNERWYSTSHKLIKQYSQRFKFHHHKCNIISISHVCLRKLYL